MNQEILGTVMAAVSYGSALYTGQKLQESAQQDELAVINAHGPVNNSAETCETETLLRTGATKYLAPIAIFAAVGAGLFPSAFMSSEKAQKPTAPNVVVAVDRSGQESYDASDQPITSLVAPLLKDARIDTQFIVARGGSFVDGAIAATDVKSNINFSPAGAVSIADTTNLAIGNASSNRPNLQSNAIGKQHNQHTSAVLFIDNGNSLGSPLQIEADALANNESIYIANVKGTDLQVNQSLQDIASKTGGEYWAVSGNSNQAARTIEAAINPVGISLPKPKDNQSKWLLKAIDIIAGLGAIEAGLELKRLNFKRSKKR